MKILDRYILKSHLGPFLLGFLVTTGFLFTQVLRNYLDEFLAKGVAPFTMAEVFLLSLGHTLALSIPMSVLVAVLMAFSQIAHDNEFTALKASGVHLYRIMAPVLLASVLLTLGMFGFNNFLLPETNHRLAGLVSDISRKKPTVTIEPGIIVDEFEGYQIYVGNKNEDSDEILDVQIAVLDEDRPPKFIVAPRGRLNFRDGGATMIIELFDGEMHEAPKNSRSHTDITYRVTHFENHTVIIREADRSLKRTDRKVRSDREMTVAMLKNSIREKHQRIADLRQRVHQQGRKRVETKLSLLSAANREQYWKTQRRPRPGRLASGAERNMHQTAKIENGAVDSYHRQIRGLQVEVHKKFAIPFACIVFVLCGSPIAIRSGRSGTTMAAAFSIAIFTVYYLFITGGEKLADRRMLPPSLAMWSANIVFATLGLILTRQTVNESSVINWRRLDPRSWFRAKRKVVSP